MNNAQDFAGMVGEWANTQPSIKAVVLIGSRIRPPSDGVWRADEYSDWDFHIISSQPALFREAAWARNLQGLNLISYAARYARIGGVPKINVVFREAEADFVVMPSGVLTMLHWALLLGLHRHSKTTRRRLQELAVVIRPGWKFLKGSETWERFYQRSILAVPDPRLADDSVRNIADGFVCDCITIQRKIERGEFVAAQRLIHRDLIEVNLRLLHELRLRRGERSFPEARRIERVASPDEVEAISTNTSLESESLKRAVEKNAESFRHLVRNLVGETWQWPAPLLMRRS